MLADSNYGNAAIRIRSLCGGTPVGQPLVPGRGPATRPGGSCTRTTSRSWRSCPARGPCPSPSRCPRSGRRPAWRAGGAAWPRRRGAGACGSRVRRERLSRRRSRERPPAAAPRSGCPLPGSSSAACAGRRSSFPKPTLSLPQTPNSLSLPIFISFSPCLTDFLPLSLSVFNNNNTFYL